MSKKKNRTFSKDQLLFFALAFGVIGAVFLFHSFAAPNPNLPGDLNNDNKVDAADLTILTSNYGASNSSADINGDGKVNVLDLSIMMTHWGQSLGLPIVNLSASPSNITSGQSSTLTWSSSNTSSCTASGAWSGSKATSGTASTGTLSVTSSFTLTCTGPGGSANKSTTVSVGSASAWPKYGISDGARIMVRSSTDQDFEIGQNKAIGAQIMRLDYYQPSTNDPVIQKALNAGLQVELVIAGTSKAPGQGTSYMANLATTAATKWKGKVKFYEVFNEPDLNGYTADTYVPYLKAVYTAIKTADPNAIVWHGGVWDCNQANTCMIDWLDREYQLGAKNYFDAYNFHCYGNLNQHGSWQEWDMVYGSGGAGFYDSRNIRSVMNANGDQSKPIVCTEGGENSNGHGLTAQADDVTFTLGAVDGIGTGNRKLKTAFIYTMMNDDVPGFGLLDDSRNKRPAWTSYYNAVPH